MYRSIPGLKFNELPPVEEITQSYVIATQDPETQILYRASIEEVVNSALGDAIIDDVGDGTVKGAIFYLSQYLIRGAQTLKEEIVLLVQSMLSQQQQAIDQLSHQQGQLVESIDNKVTFKGIPSESINLSVVGTDLKITVGDSIITVSNVTVGTPEE